MLTLEQGMGPTLLESMLSGETNVAIENAELRMLKSLGSRFFLILGQVFIFTDGEKQGK